MNASSRRKDFFYKDWIVYLRDLGVPYQNFKTMLEKYRETPDKVDEDIVLDGLREWENGLNELAKILTN